MKYLLCLKREKIKKTNHSNCYSLSPHFQEVHCLQINVKLGRKWHSGWLVEENFWAGSGLLLSTGKRNAANARGHQPQLHKASPLLEAVIPFDPLKPNAVSYILPKNTTYFPGFAEVHGWCSGEHETVFFSAPTGMIKYIF